MSRKYFSVLLCLLLIGCTNANRPLNPIDKPVTTYTSNATRATLAPSPGQDRFVGMALSGGGLRAANFSAACMFELQRLGVLQQVQCISSVSGGSMVAAYYCTAPDEDWNIQAVQKHLMFDYQDDVIVETFAPWNWPALMFTDYDRADLFKSSLDRYLLGEKTFRNLRSDRPRLLINATNLASGRGFIFDNETFDRLNSDLLNYPIAYAVAASAAFPVALHPVTLRDYSSYVPGYVHLIDGGVSDNLGIRTLMHAYESGKYKKGAIFIVIDSRTLYDASIAHEGDVGLTGSTRYGLEISATQILNSVSDASLDQVISDLSKANTTNEMLRKRIKDFKLNGVINFRDRSNRPITIVHISLPNVSRLEEAPPGFAGELNNIPTSLNISKDEIYSLYKAAELLIHHNEKTLRDLTPEKKIR